MEFNLFIKIPKKSRDRVKVHSNRPVYGTDLEGTGTKTTLIYDITSLSSYSQLINLLEYGYNHNGDSLPQINLSLILDKDKGIPVMYDIYPGRIADVSTISGTLQKIRAHGIHDYFAIMHRGLFSKDNLE